MKKTLIAMTLIVVLLLALYCASTAAAAPLDDKHKPASEAVASDSKPKQKADEPSTWSPTTLIGTAVAAVVVLFNFFGPSSPSYTPQSQDEALAKFAAEPGVVSFEGGKLLVKVLRKGDGNGKSPNLSDSTDMHYELKILNSGNLNDVVDSSYARGAVSPFAPNQVVSSWTKIMQMMTDASGGVGDSFLIAAHSDLAYGNGGRGGKIQGFSTLLFKMEMVRVKSGGKSVSEARKLWQDQSDKKVAWDDVQVVSA